MPLISVLWQSHGHSRKVTGLHVVKFNIFFLLRGILGSGFSFHLFCVVLVRETVTNVCIVGRLLSLFSVILMCINYAQSHLHSETGETWTLFWTASRKVCTLNVWHNFVFLFLHLGAGGFLSIIGCWVSGRN